MLASSQLFAQKLKFKIEGQKDTTIHLIKYFGKGLFYADTAEIKNGIVEFDGSKQKAGVLAVFLPDQKMLEFIYNEEEVYIETSLPDMMGGAKVKKSEENKIFIPYVRFINEKRTNANMLTEERKNFEVGTAKYEDLTIKIDRATEEVEAYQQKIIDEHWDKFVSRMIKMSIDVKAPDAPVNSEGKIIDSNFRFLYYRAHYWDNIDLKDDRLCRTPIFHTKLKKYFSDRMMIQHWDTVIYYAFDFCDRLVPSSDMYQYVVSWLTAHYEKSKIMGMDKVFVYMGERYYCTFDADGKSPMSMMKDDKLKELCEKVTTYKDLVMGAKPPNISLRDTTDVTWRNFYSLKSEYTILYFWDPECGHCKKITPKLQTLYSKKWRDRNIEVFAVGKAVGEDFEKWKKFVRTNNLEFINVAVTDKLYKAAMEDARQFVPKYTTLESLNYQQTYDIYATPKVYILDKDKKIVGKSLTVSQLEELMDRLQGKADLEKVFPMEEEVDKENNTMH